MKKYIILFYFLILLFPLSVSAQAVTNVNYDIDSYKIDAYISNNGDMNVCEYIKQTGSFNGYVRDIFYKSGEEEYTPSYLVD